MATPPVISLHLSRVLDEIGLNKLTVKTRKETSLYKECTLSLCPNIFDKIIVHMFGSQAEGTTTLGLDSDFDLLYCHHHYKVLQDLTEWTGDQPNLLMLRESTAPGYCRLQVMKQDRPEPETLPSEDCTFNEYNRVILTNSFFDEFDPDYIRTNRSGPAITMHMEPLTDFDITNAFMCTSRLKATEKWARRKGRSGWPTASLIKQVKDEPFFLVPVGNKLSPTKDVEWRISLSLAERCLMFSLNMVQIKCYVTMKILLKSFLTPFVGKRISSYHCKTALFYCIESSKANIWREDNLLPCITRCWNRILAWVKNGFCPHFILQETNLFAGKVTTDNKGILQCALRKLITENLDSLLRVSIDGLGTRLRRRLGTKPKHSPILDSIETFNILGDLELRKQFTPAMLYYDYYPTYNLTSSTSDIQIAKTILESRTNFANEIQQEATKQTIMYLRTLLGSVLASSALGRHARIPQDAIDLLDDPYTSGIPSLLKHASVFYCGGELQKVDKICKKVNGHFERENVFPVCQCKAHVNILGNEQIYSSEQYKVMYIRRDKVRYAHCLSFSPHEIHCVPKALRYEQFRAVGEDLQQKTFRDDWMNRAVVDCRTFLYFLQYMTYRELGNEERRKQSLQKLERRIKEENQLLFHVETAWNILGQCYETENLPDWALHCYKKSLDIRPRNNAVNWLVPVLLYLCTQGRYILFDF